MSVYGPRVKRDLVKSRVQSSRKTAGGRRGGFILPFLIHVYTLKYVDSTMLYDYGLTLVVECMK